MATITERRMYPFPHLGGMPIQMPLGLTGDAESESEIPGACLVDDGAGLLEVNNSAPALGAIVALLEAATPAAVAAGDKYPCTIILPNFIFEGSPSTGATARTDMYTNAPLVGSNAAATGGFAQFTVGAGTANVRLFAFASDFGVVQKLGEYIGQSATSVTAGGSNTPAAGVQGIAGDTTARVLLFFPAPACLLCS